MADAIKKLLAKVSAKERSILEGTIDLLIRGKLGGHDTKKLAGSDNFFRVRKGKFRIIYKITKTDVKIVDVTRRSDTTYNNF